MDDRGKAVDGAGTTRSPAVDHPVDPEIRRNTSGKPLVGLAVPGVEISHVTGNGDRPGGDPGASEAAGDRSNRRVLENGGWFRGVDGRAIDRLDLRTVPRGAPTGRPDGKRTWHRREARRPGNRTASGRGTVSRSAPTEQSDGKRTRHQRGAARRPSDRTARSHPQRPDSASAERSAGSGRGVAPHRRQLSDQQPPMQGWRGPSISCMEGPSSCLTKAPLPPTTTNDARQPRPGSAGRRRPTVPPPPRWRGHAPSPATRGGSRRPAADCPPSRPGSRRSPTRRRSRCPGPP